MRVLVVVLIVVYCISCGRDRKDIPHWAKSQKNWTALMKWAYEGDTIKIDSALKSGMHPDTTNYRGWTALKVAVKAGKADVVKIQRRSKFT
jgi:hypothetical protein